MKRKLIALFLLWLLNFTTCICPKNEQITNTLVRIHTARSLIFSFHENGSYPYLEKFDRNNLGVLIGADSVTQRVELLSQFSSGINSVYACSPQRDQMNYENYIDSMSVITLYDFDSRHPKNSVVDDILFQKNEGDNLVPPSDSTFLNPAIRATYSAKFKFSITPQFDTLQFLVSGRINGGNNFQIKTEMVVLK